MSFSKYNIVLLTLFLTGCSRYAYKPDYNAETSVFPDKPYSSLDSNDYSSGLVDSANHTNSFTADNEKIDPQNQKELWEIQLDSIIDRLATLREQSDTNETYCFFTDPHCFLPTGDYSFDSETIVTGFNRLELAYRLSLSSFIVCGGDVLNNSDSKPQACYKLSYFNSLMKSYFDNSYYIVGNHDTNYQGDTYMNNSDYNSCMLSQNTLNDILFDGKKSYYTIKTNLSSYYCFDSGVDWNDYAFTDFRKEQVDWFADSLLYDKKPHKAIFIHMAFSKNEKRTAMMQKIEEVVGAYNYRKKITINSKQYDYKDAIGKVHFAQGGHEHRDREYVLPNGVPVFLTRSFSCPGVSTQPTFDIVFEDYTNHRIELLRIGDGFDREYYLPFLD